MNKSIITFNEVSKIYNQGSNNAFQAINKLNCNFEKGKIQAIEGASGSGKSTLLSLICGLTRPTTGRISLDGENISSLPESFLTRVRRDNFGFIFQQFNLIHGLSVLDNVMLPAYPIAQPYKKLRMRALSLLADFELDKREQTKIELLSGGEQQRVAIARSLINNPKILIADEPTANIDSALAKTFLDVLAKINSAGTTIIVASHDPLLLESKLISRIISMRDGQIVQTIEN